MNFDLNHNKAKIERFSLALLKCTIVYTNKISWKSFLPYNIIFNLKSRSFQIFTKSRDIITPRSDWRPYLSKVSQRR